MTLTPRKSYALILLAYVAGLWAMSIPLTGDQKVYLSVALEMKERGEWIVPYLFDAPNFLKPPLQYWATLIGWKIFGLSLFGAFIPSVLALVGSAALTNKLFGSVNGMAGLLFASCVGTMTYGTTAQMEVWIVLFYLWSWLEWRRERPWYALALVGVMAWVKGPLYPVLWVISAAAERVINKKKFEWKHLGALVLGGVIGLAWYGLAASSQWAAMRDVFLKRENLGKMQTSQGTPWGLWGEFFYSLYPWCPLIFLVVFSAAARAQWKAKKSLILAYAFLPALFFTFFPYRVNTYLYLLTPILAWMASLADHEPLTRNGRRAYLWLAGYFAIVAILLLVVSLRLAQGGWIGWELAILLIPNLLLWPFLFIRRNWTGFAVVCLMLVNCIRVGAIQIGERDLMGLREFHARNPERQLAYWIQEKDIWHEFGLVSAALGQDVKRLDEFQLGGFLRETQGALLLSDEQQKQASEMFPGLSCDIWPRIKRRLRFPFQQLVREGLSAADPQVIREFFICQSPQKLDNNQ